MEYSNTVDMMTLSWYVPEIRESLLRVAEALDEQLAAPQGSTDAITRARLHLHQTHGALQVAGMDGVVLLTQEAELVLAAIEDGTLDLDAQGATVLKRVLNAVVEYLEDLHQGGVMVPPLVLFPYYRDLVGLRKVLPPDPTVLFAIELDRVLPASVRAQVEQGPDREERARNAARAFERMLPALIRGENVAGAIATLHEAMLRLLRTQPHENARLFYWLSFALLDGLKHGALKVDLATRRAVGRINIQNRHLFSAQQDVPVQFIKELLLLLAHAGSGSAAIDEVKAHFQLSERVPADYERPRYGLADPATLAAAREALTQVHRSWEKIASGAGSEVPAFNQSVAQLNQALERTHYKGLAMLGKTLATMPSALARQQDPAAEMLAIEVATAVLFMEEALAGALRSNPSYDDRSQELAARIGQLLAQPEQFDPTPLPWLVALSIKATDRVTQTAFVNELKQNLASCEQALDDYFRDESAVASLEGVEPLLAETAAVLTLLDYKDPARACRAISEQVRSIVEARVTLDDGLRTQLADGISSLGFFVDIMLQSTARAHHFRFDAARGMLYEDTRLAEAEAGAQAAAVQSAEIAVLAEAEAEAGMPDGQVAAEAGAQEVAAEADAQADAAGADDAALAVAGDAGDTVVDDGVVELSPEDAELHEIFLMEAAEVIDAIGESLEAVRRAPDDREAMTTIRRGFHTLKGSSRMVGLDAFGEAAWSFEQMMNHWLAEDRDGIPSLFELIRDGADFFRDWTGQLQHAPRRVLDARELSARCSAFPDKPAPVAASPAAAPKAQAATAPAAAVASVEPATGAASVMGVMPAEEIAPATADAPVAAALAASDDAPDLPEAATPAEPLQAAGADAVPEVAWPGLAEEAPAAAFEPVSAGPLDEDGVPLLDDAFPSLAGIDTSGSLELPDDVASGLDASLPDDLAEAVEGVDGVSWALLDGQEPVELGGVEIPSFGGEPVSTPAAPAALDEAGLPTLPMPPANDGFSQSHNFASVDGHQDEAEVEQRLDGFLGQSVATDVSFAQDEGLVELPGNLPAFEALLPKDAAGTPGMSLDIHAEDEPDLADEEDALQLGNLAGMEDIEVDSAFMVPAPEASDEDIPLLDLGDAVRTEPAPAARAEADVFMAGAFMTDAVFGAPFDAQQAAAQTAEAAQPTEPAAPVAADVFAAPAEVAPAPETPRAAAAPVPAEAAPAASVEVPLQPEPVVTPAVVPPAAVPAASQPATSPVAAETPVDEQGEALVRIGDRLIDAELFEIFNAEAHRARMRMNEDWSNWHASDALRAPETLVRALHTLVGTSRHVGLVQVRGIASALEKMLLKQRESACPLPDGVKASIQAALGVIDRMLAEFASRIEPAADPETTARMEALLENWDAELASTCASCESAPAEARPREMRGEDLLKKAAEVLGAARRGTEEKRDPLAGLVDEIDPDLGPVFFEEAEELMPQVDNALREWRERPADGSMPAALMRLFHTIKGSARMAGAMRFGQMIHELETQVEEALAQPTVQESLIEAVLSGYDQAVSAYEIMLHPELASEQTPAPAVAEPDESGAPEVAAESDIEAPVAAAPAPVVPEQRPADTAAPARQPVVDCVATAAASSSAAAAQHVIRVRADLLDRMVSEAGEVAIARARLDSEMGLIRSAINELTENVNRLRLQLREIEIQADNQIQAKIAHSNETETDFDPLEFDRYTRFQEVTRMLAESVNDVSTVQQNALRALDAAMQDLARQGQVSRSLQQSLMRVRMVQFSTINDRLYRVVRQAGKDTDKRVTLEIKGGQAEIDRNVLDRMAGPIEHILRNSVAHGIEDKTRRAQVGKPEVGELTIEVTQDGNEVIMRFLDDGQGLDLPKIEARARERGLIEPDHQPSERELAQLIFAPGFSTAKQVTALAGRGVGMDVVRAEVAGLGGRIDLDTTTGKGSCVTVHLPLSLAVTQVVLLAIDGAKFAVQSALVEQIVQMKPEALTEAYQNQRIEIGGEKVPFYFLGSLLEMAGVKPAAQRVAPVVLLRAGATRIALHVDTVVPNQEVVIKHIGPQLARLAGVAGATVLGNGDIVLILNPVQLAMARVAGQVGTGKAATFSASELQTAATVMVVDDSVTVRKVTQRLLVREGYNVLLAKDGVDALRQMQETVPDVMLVDIEMPRMDGFDLTKNVRAHADYANVPIIMITSRTADKHRNHALDLGVDVFLGKPFSEDELLRHVRSFAAQRAPRVTAG